MIKRNLKYSSEEKMKKPKIFAVKTCREDPWADLRKKTGVTVFSEAKSSE